MLEAKPLSKSVPRVEYDQRAREARLQFEQLERLLVNGHALETPRPVQRFRLFRFSLYRTAREDNDRSTGSPSDRRPCGIEPTLFPVFCR